MGIVGKQFGRPEGFMGSLAGWFMARNNAAFNRWVAREATAAVAGDPKRIVEIGSGPGVGTQALLAAAPASEVTAVDPSAMMHRRLRKRNRRELASGQLRTVTGDLNHVVGKIHEVDLVVAVHVLYFWRDPVEELRRIRELLRSGGMVALGYQLRHDMAPIAQRDFPEAGHRLYDADEWVADLVAAAGLDPQPVRVLGPQEQPTGRLLLGSRLS